MLSSEQWDIVDTALHRWRNYETGRLFTDDEYVARIDATLAAIQQQRQEATVWEPVKEGSEIELHSGGDNMGIPKPRKLVVRSGSNIMLVMEKLNMKGTESQGYLMRLPPDTCLCRRSTVAAEPVKMDAPDGVGHYAYQDGDTRWVVELTKWDVSGGVVTYHFSTWQGPPITHTYMYMFKQNYPGKWYRLTMPWDTHPNA